MINRSATLETLSEEECKELLTRTHVGRLVMVADGRPLVFPVNYVFDGSHVGVRTDAGTKLSGAPMRDVAFEIDGIDDATVTGWSVVVSGVGHDVTDAIDQASEALRSIPLEPWAPGEKGHWLRIDAEQITGRRLRP